MYIDKTCSNLDANANSYLIYKLSIFLVESSD